VKRRAFDAGFFGVKANQLRTEWLSWRNAQNTIPDGNRPGDGAFGCKASTAVSS
jgi:hypothetical protein